MGPNPLPLTKLSETATKLVLGWAPVPGCVGYAFFADGKRVANTWDPARSQVSFAKGATVYRVDALGVSYSGSYPPSSGLLAYKPPGWNGGNVLDPASFPGFIVIDVTGPGVYPAFPDDTKDYYFRVNVDAVAAASGGRQAVYLRGGRHRVVVGGKVYLTSQVTTGDAADPSAFILDDGNPVGVTHIEGCDLKSSNGVTVRTKQRVQIQWCRIAVRAFQDNHSYCHPDVIQTWDRGPSAGVAVDYLSCVSGYTGLSILMAPNPDRFDVSHLDMRRDPNHSGPCVYFGDEKKTVWAGSAWVTDLAGTSLDDAAAGWGADNVAYEIHAGPSYPAGVYTSPDPPPGGDCPPPLGQRQGDYITYARVPALAAMRWTYGTPGEYVPAGSVGAGYVSKGYR